MTDGMMKIGARLAVLAMVGFGASACSSVPDWVDPTNWVGPSDNEQAAGETPDLATLPDRPTGTSTAAEQQDVSQSLDADRSRAKYSADALRGGTEAEAAPPPPASAMSPEQIAAAQKSATPPPAPAPAPAVSPDADTVTVPQGNDTQTAAASPAPSPPPQAAPLPPASAPAPAMETPPPVAQASTLRRPAPSRAASPPSPARTAMASVDPSDAALGFRPSTAPPLDPSVSQFVPAPIVSRYQQTNSSQVASIAPMRSSGASSAQPSVYANPTGMQPSSVVYFPGDGTLLSAEGRAQVRAAAKAFKQNGGQGYVRVVGHASSRTSNMAVEKHLEVIFNKSQDRANAVAKEMIRDGVPASHVLVEAVGDSQPVYYESMPKGEDGNRRAEIFLQG
jgi:outer membrane protein OmpA-like peptidoglycan-associated protein